MNYKYEYKTKFLTNICYYLLPEETCSILEDFTLSGDSVLWISYMTEATHQHLKT